MMKHLLHILLLVIGMTAILPAVAPRTIGAAAVYAADAKTQAQREKEKAKAQKAKEKAKAQKEKEKAKAQKEKEKAKAQREKEKAQAQKAKEKAKAQQAKAKAKSSGSAKPAKKQVIELSPAEEKAHYTKLVADIEKNNQRLLAYANRDIDHRLGAWGQVGYSNLFTSGIGFDAAAAGNPVGFKNTDQGFVGGGLGLGYQMRYRQFLMTVGAEFNFYNSVMAFANREDGLFSLTYSMNPYPSMQYTYTFSGMNDKLIGGFVQVPLLAGMELKQFPLFWLAGLKIGVGALGQSTIRGSLTTTITDTELIDPMTDMYNHTLVTDQAVDRPTTNVKFGLNLAASAEVGVNLNQWINAKPQMRVSVFADYGLLNSLSYQPTPAAQDIPTRMLEEANPLNYPVNSTLATTSAANAQVHPFLVGVKMAVWLNLPRKQIVIGDMPSKPLPRMGIYAYDIETNSPLGGVDVAYTEVAADKTKRKNTNRQGLISAGRVPEGQYRIVATKNGYTPSDEIFHMVEEFTYDTVRVPLKHIEAPIVYTLCMNVYDVQTNEPIEAAVRFTSLTDTLALYAAQSADDGFIETPLTEGDYIAHMLAQGYMPKEDTLHFVRDTFDVFMQPIRRGIKVKIENLFFATNKTYILPQSEQAMSELAGFLLENPGVTIHIVGHTDAVGSDEANQILSEGRANAVRADLIKRGVAAERMTAEGKGEKEPVADNDTDEGRQLNRRVEFTITGTDGADIEQIR